MKKLMFFMLSLLILSACQSDSGGGSNGTTNNATTPLNMDCINGSTYCNNNQYYQYNGFMPYPGLYNYAYNYVNHFYNYGFCNCPSGYSPVYNGSLGLGCVMNGYMNNIGGMVVTWNWSFGPFSGQSSVYAPAAPPAYNNYPQTSNINQQFNTYTCTRTLSQSCFTNQPGSCGPGSTCRQTTIGSNLGICVNY